MFLLGLAGYPLKHSFSPSYFRQKYLPYHPALEDYLLFEPEHAGQIPALFREHLRLRGLNVTMPYKSAVIPYLDSLSAEAQSIGAVNVIKAERTGGQLRLYGYNTDGWGFEESLKPYLQPQHHSALVLGTGGVARTVCHVLRLLGIRAEVVSRTLTGNVLTYRHLNRDIMQAHQLIVNTTPAGMYPDMVDCPDIPYRFVGKSHLLFDLIYNPSDTLFLQQGRQRGATTVNGYQMFVCQADRSWQIWNAAQERG